MVDSVAPTRARRAGWAGPQPLVAAAIVGTLLLWASAFVAIRAIGDTFSPGSMALLRLVAGSAALTVFVLARGRGRPPRRPSRRSAALIAGYGVAWFAGYTVALNAAERHLDAGTAAMLVNVAPILVAVIAGRLLGEGYPRPLLIGIVISFAGVALIAAGGPGAHGDGLGVLLGLASAVLYAAGVLFQKVTLRAADALTATWLGCVVGTVVLLPFAGVALDELGPRPLVGGPCRGLPGDLPDRGRVHALGLRADPDRRRGDGRHHAVGARDRRADVVGGARRAADGGRAGRRRAVPARRGRVPAAGSGGALSRVGVRAGHGARRRS